MSFTTRHELDQQILNNPYLPDHLKEQVDRSESDQAQISNSDGDMLLVSRPSSLDGTINVCLRGEDFEANLRFDQTDIRQLAEWVLH